jgi:hypothetical protein
MFSPASSPASHLSHTSSVEQVRQRWRTSFMMVSESPLDAITGSSPIFISMVDYRIESYLYQHGPHAPLGLSDHVLANCVEKCEGDTHHDHGGDDLKH